MYTGDFNAWKRISGENRKKRRVSQIFRALITFRDPLLKLLGVAGSEPNLEGLRLGRQRRSNSIALNCIEDGSISRLFGWAHVECGDQADERREKLPVCKVGSRTHARTRSVAVMGSTSTVAEIHISLGDKLVGILEVILVVISSPRILWKVSKSPRVPEMESLP